MWRVFGGDEGVGAMSGRKGREGGEAEERVEGGGEDGLCLYC